MKISKIIKGIVGISVISGIAYVAYKYGEKNQKQTEIDNEDYDFYDDEDEEDYFEVRDNSEETPHEFKPFCDVKINGVSENKLSALVLYICSQKSITNQTIRDYFGIDDFYKASDVLDALIDAGYIGRMTPTYRFPVLITFNDYLKLTQKE